MSKNFINLKKLEKKIHIGFFTSKGGVSKGDYDSLNCGNNNFDNKKNVRKNINTALDNLGIGNKALKLITQIHSNKIYSINKNNYRKKLRGDGLFTSDKTIALGVLTADCAPIFIFDIKKGIICCLHSGWKGTLNNIDENCIKKLENRKVIKNNVVAIIGPCLGFKNFEVDRDFKQKFIRKNQSYYKFFKKKNKNKDLFNLRGIINYQLKKEGIKNIYNINRDTYRNSGFFFSHRRSKHQNKINTGRMINIISLKD